VVSIFNEQNGLDPITEMPLKIWGEGRSDLHIDHDKDKGFVRGLLEGSTNRGVGMMDNDWLIWKVLQYKAHPPAVRAIGMRMVSEATFYGRNRGQSHSVSERYFHCKERETEWRSSGGRLIIAEFERTLEVAA
jgi:hypothetical protein